MFLKKNKRLSFQIGKSFFFNNGKDKFQNMKMKFWKFGRLFCGGDMEF